MNKLFYWHYNIERMYGNEMGEEYYSGYSPNLSEPDLPEYAEIEEGVFLTLDELRSRDAEIARKALEWFQNSLKEKIEFEQRDIKEHGMGNFISSLAQGSKEAYETILADIDDYLRAEGYLK